MADADAAAAAAGGVAGMSASELSVDMHAGFVKRQSEDKDTIEYVLTEHLRLSGVYWGLTGMRLMGRLDDMDGEAIVEWVMKCRHDCGGFGGSEGHDPHILYTLSAVQVGVTRVSMCVWKRICFLFFVFWMWGVAPGRGGEESCFWIWRARHG